MANRRNKFNDKINISNIAIKKYRKEKKLTRQKLSIMLALNGVDISAQSIANIENATRTVVDYELCAIAEALQVSVLDLLENYTSNKFN